jgi:hypothetical protein
MRIIRTLLVFLALAIPAVVFGQIGIRIAIGPPALPIYEQSICPGDGYLWTPGYWTYDDSVSDYYWVPGTWVLAPEEGFLWTPGYWGWGDGGFVFNDGYWGPEVGFYGGINYGFGYFGEGYEGGRWDNGHFFYNRSVNNVDSVNIHNVYTANVTIKSNENRVSYNGGVGGIEVRANSKEEAAARQNHIPAVAAQTEHAQAARSNRESRASVNHGRPTTTTTSLPVGFNDRQTSTPARATEPAKAPVSGAASESRVEAPAVRLDNVPTRPAVHPNDLPPIARPAPANSGNAKADKKYEQKQDKLIATQTQERQQLQQRQDAEHQQTVNASTQKLDQKHQQQTQALQQKHSSQQQSLQTHQPHASQPQSHESGSESKK